jgi:hypothetical protein
LQPLINFDDNLLKENIQRLLIPKAPI